MELLNAVCRTEIEANGVERPHICAAARAMLLEAAGEKALALAEWRALRAATSAAELTLRSRADVAIRRLQTSAPGKGR